MMFCSFRYLEHWLFDQNLAYEDPQVPEVVQTNPRSPAAFPIMQDFEILGRKLNIQRPARLENICKSMYFHANTVKGFHLAVTAP